MAKLLSATTPKGHDKVHALFDAGGPLLIEVRHPGAIESSDWFLCESGEEFDSLLVRLNANVIMHVSRVWDLTNQAGTVVLRR